MLSDIELVLRRCCQKGLPTYLLGHGLGSLLILGLLQENPNLGISGVICLSPLFTFPFFTNSDLMDKVLLFLLSKVWPYLQISNMINPTALTNNPRKIKNYLDGVFNYQFLSIGMADAHCQLSEKVLEDAPKFKYPLLFLYGSKDTVQTIDDVKRFYCYAGSQEKSSYVFKNGFHHLHDDERADKEVFPRIVEWILDLNSNKNLVKWTVPPPLNVQIVKKIPSSVKYVILVLLPLLVTLLMYLRAKVSSRH